MTCDVPYKPLKSFTGSLHCLGSSEPSSGEIRQGEKEREKENERRKNNEESERRIPSASLFIR